MIVYGLYDMDGNFRNGFYKYEAEAKKIKNGYNDGKELKSQWHIEERVV